MEREYTPKELTYLLNLKKKIVEPHKPCGGIGYLDEKDTCDCMKVFMYLKELFYCNIPLDYWGLSLSDLKVDTVYKKVTADYIENIDNAISKGLGIIYLGNRGIGKTALMAEIAKEAVVRRYVVFYEIVQNIVNDYYTDEHRILERIKSADLVIIDEFEKVMMKKDSNIPKQMENFFRELLPNRKPIIASSNLDEEELTGKFEFMSLLKRYIKIIEMEGTDFSEKKQADWMNQLRGEDIDYMTPNFIRMARRFFKNQWRADEREFNSLF